MLPPCHSACHSIFRTLSDLQTNFTLAYHIRPNVRSPDLASSDFPDDHDVETTMFESWPKLLAEVNTIIGTGVAIRNINSFLSASSRAISTLAPLSKFRKTSTAASNPVTNLEASVVSIYA